MDDLWHITSFAKHVHYVQCNDTFWLSSKKNRSFLNHNSLVSKQRSFFGIFSSVVTFPKVIDTNNWNLIDTFPRKCLKMVISGYKKSDWWMEKKVFIIQWIDRFFLIISITIFGNFSNGIFSYRWWHYEYVQMLDPTIGILLILFFIAKYVHYAQCNDMTRIIQNRTINNHEEEERKMVLLNHLHLK